MIRDYLSLVKSPQTLLLVFTGVAGFASGGCPVLEYGVLAAVAGSLLLVVSGSTVLNMVLDKDIDSKMNRTSCRPLPAGRVSTRGATWFGILLSLGGLGWAAALAPLYGAVVLTGLLLDVVVYTLWLKRRTPWSIVWGGLAGGMPILAGRTLAVGRVDSLGLLLGLAIVLWIPMHIMTFSIKCAADYQRAGVPVFPNVFSVETTQVAIAVSTAAAAATLVLIAAQLGGAWGYVRAIGALGFIMVALAGWNLLRPSLRSIMVLFKCASLYMIGAMVLLVLGS